MNRCLHACQVKIRTLISSHWLTCMLACLHVCLLLLLYCLLILTRWWKHVHTRENCETKSRRSRPFISIRNYTSPSDPDSSLPCSQSHFVLMVYRTIIHQTHITISNPFNVFHFYYFDWSVALVKNISSPTVILRSAIAFSIYSYVYATKLCNWDYFEIECGWKVLQKSHHPCNYIDSRLLSMTGLFHLISFCTPRRKDLKVASRSWYVLMSTALSILNQIILSTCELRLRFAISKSEEDNNDAPTIDDHDCSGDVTASGDVQMLK